MFGLECLSIAWYLHMCSIIIYRSRWRKKSSPISNPSQMLFSKVPNDTWRMWRNPQSVGKGFPNIGMQDGYQEILSSVVSETPNIYCFSDVPGTYVVVSSDRYPLQAKYSCWIASGTMHFALKMDFVEYNDANRVNVTDHSEWFNYVLRTKI